MKTQGTDLGFMRGRAHHPGQHLRTLITVAMILAVLTLLCACGGQAGPTEAETSGAAEDTTAENTAPAMTELMFPDGSVHPVEESCIDLSTLHHRDVEDVAELLQQMPRLRHVNLGEEDGYSDNLEVEENCADGADAVERDENGNPEAETAAEQSPLTETAAEQLPSAGTRGLTWEDVRTLQEACPEAEVDYRFTLFGKKFSTLDTEMDFRHVEMDDEGAAVREVLPCMTKCALLDMDFTGVSSAKMAEIRDAYPDMKVVWRIWFGSDCSVRTDVERILASNLNHALTDDNTEDLKYCTKVRLLDIGHNFMLTNFSFLEYMPDLEVAIVAITGLHDLTPLANHEKLEYLEINTCAQDMDLSPLGTCPNLEHVCATYLGHVTGWEAFKNLTKLQRLWFGQHTYLPDGALEELQEALPDTVIDTKSPYGDDGEWRYEGHHLHPRYALLKQQFEYSNYDNVCSSWYNDPLYYKEGESHYRPRW